MNANNNENAEVYIGFRAPERLAEYLKNAAAKSHRSMSKYVVYLIEEDLKASRDSEFRVAEDTDEKPRRSA